MKTRNQFCLTGIRFSVKHFISFLLGICFMWVLKSPVAVEQFNQTVVDEIEEVASIVKKSLSIATEDLETIIYEAVASSYEKDSPKSDAILVSDAMKSKEYQLVVYMTKAGEWTTGMKKPTSSATAQQGRQFFLDKPPRKIIVHDSS